MKNLNLIMALSVFLCVNVATVDAAAHTEEDLVIKTPEDILCCARMRIFDMEGLIPVIRSDLAFLKSYAQNITTLETEITKIYEDNAEKQSNVDEALEAATRSTKNVLAIIKKTRQYEQAAVNMVEHVQEQAIAAINMATDSQTAGEIDRETEEKICRIRIYAQQTIDSAQKVVREFKDYADQAANIAAKTIEHAARLGIHPSAGAAHIQP